MRIAFQHFFDPFAQTIYLLPPSYFGLIINSFNTNPPIPIQNLLYLSSSLFLFLILSSRFLIVRDIGILELDLFHLSFLVSLLVDDLAVNSLDLVVEYFLDGRRIVRGDSTVIDTRFPEILDKNLPLESVL